MPRAPLNKSTMTRESAKLLRYREFLPSLDLKRRQLLALLAKERAEVRSLADERDRLVGDLTVRVPMLADPTIDLDGLVVVRRVGIDERNVLGTRLPEIAGIDVQRADYSLLAKPHWVDVVAGTLERVLSLDVRIDVAQERVRLLAHASRIVTQRVNLFERVLIPRAEAQIRHIRIMLADAERYAAVRGKIAKAKSQRRAAEGASR